MKYKPLTKQSWKNYQTAEDYLAYMIVDNEYAYNVCSALYEVKKLRAKVSRLGMEKSRLKSELKALRSE